MKTADQSSPASVGVIISTYNNPSWLEKTLWSYLRQSVMPDEILIADDGSGPETKALIDRFAKELPLKHVWHEDRGFRKTEILNKAIMSSTAEYLIFTDQDCVAREDFVAAHIGRARRGRFLSGGVVKLSMSISRDISGDDIAAGRAFDHSWLKSRGYKGGIKKLKLTRNRFTAFIMNHITPAKATWNGGNSSGWRDDILAANGFNQDMQYGNEDREFGQRLINMGVRPIKIRYSAVALHLDHNRPYKNTEIMAKNLAIRQQTKRLRTIRTPNGIVRE